MSEVAIIGNASWGTALGITLGRKGVAVKLWTRTPEAAEEINRSRENVVYLPGFRFPPSLSATNSIEEATDGSKMVILAVPAHSMRLNIRWIKDYLDDSMLILSATKGLELDSSKRMSQVIAEEVDSRFHPNICVLSGPNLAREAAEGLSLATVVASYDMAVAKRAELLIKSSQFNVFTNTDVIGVELGGALKNVIALGTGIADGLGIGNNTKAALITRGLAEIIVLGMAMRANPMTFVGLTCLGDILATCFSPYSRNRYVGEELAKGRSISEIRASMSNVAEGVDTIIAARKLAQKTGVEMPVTEQIYKVIYEGYDPNKAITELVQHPGRGEWAEITRLLHLMVHQIREIRPSPKMPSLDKTGSEFIKMIEMQYPGSIPK